MKMWCLQGWSCVPERLRAALFLSPSQPPATWGPLLWPVLSSPRSCQAVACLSNSKSQQGVPALFWPGPNTPLSCPNLPWAPAAVALCPLGVPSLHTSVLKDTTVPVCLAPSIPCHPQILPGTHACQGRPAAERGALLFQFRVNEASSLREDPQGNSRQSHMRALAPGTLPSLGSFRWSGLPRGQCVNSAPSPPSQELQAPCALA